MGPPLNKKPSKNLLADASSQGTLTLDAAQTLKMMGRMLGEFKGRATAAARAATSRPAAATLTMALAAVNMGSLPSDTTFKSGASSAALERFWASFGRAACAFLRILEPEREKRQSWESAKGQDI